MGLPEISISFTKKASNVIKRSSRGMVVIVLDDSTAAQFMNAYRSIDDVNTDHWTDANYKLIKMVFAGEPASVIAVRAVTENGQVKLRDTLQLFKSIAFDYMVYPGFTSTDGVTIKEFITPLREKGGKAKAVVANYAGDFEGIINLTTTGISAVWDGDEAVYSYTTPQYCARIAGILAGLPLTKSSTYYVLPEIVDAVIAEDPDQEIDAGKLIIIFDGEKYKIARGVTSLQTTSEEHPEDFKKIKVVEGTDIIKHDIYTTFEDEYIGKINNTYDNKQIFVGAVNAYLTDLHDTILDGEESNYAEISTAKNLAYLKENGIDTDDMTTQEIKEANTGSKVFLDGRVKLLDAVEDLDFTLAM